MDIRTEITLAALAVSFALASYTEAQETGCRPETCFTAEKSAGKRFAVVNLSVNFLREAPDYTAELGTQALMGTVVEIVGEEGYWRQVITPEPYRAWCTALGLTEMSSTGIKEYCDAPKYICTAWHGTVYESPSEKSGKICDIIEGDILRISFRKGKPDGSYQEGNPASSRRGKPHMTKGFAEVTLPDGRKGYVRAEDVEDLKEWEASRNPVPANIISEAMKFIGVPYLWGGASPNGADCSGLVRHTFMMTGILLPRNASRQAMEGKPVELKWKTGLQDAPCIIDTCNFEKGDLLFFGTAREDGSPRITHVGIYIGGGRLIHASHYVRTSSLDPFAPDYYENTPKLIACRRILPAQSK